MAGCAHTSGHAAKGAEGRASKRMSREKYGRMEQIGIRFIEAFLEKKAFVDGFCSVFLQAEACSKKHQSRSILYISRTFKAGLTFFLIIFIIHSDGICLILHPKAKLGYIKRKISIH